MNPHTRYEIHLAKVPTPLVAALLVLASVALLMTIYLTATTPGEVIPRPHFEKPSLPNLHSIIQRRIDEHNPFVASAVQQ